MRIGIWNNYEEFNDDNKLFSADSYQLSEGMERPFVELKAIFNDNGHQFEVLKTSNLNAYDAVIFLDYPTNSPTLLPALAKLGVSCYLIILESEIVHPANWDRARYRDFSLVFSWSTSGAPEPNVVYSPIPQHFSVVQARPFSEKKLLCMISGNKASRDPRELYSSRRRVVRWSERHLASEFDLFGFGWEKGGPIFECLPGLGTRPFPSFRGSLSAKRAALSRYKFSICFENVQGIPGYLTEKIFDCLFAGCVPIYWGAPDIADMIPPECYLDFRKFKSLRTMAREITMLSEEKYLSMMSSQREFLSSKQAKEYSAIGFAERVYRKVMESLR